VYPAPAQKYSSPKIILLLSRDATAGIEKREITGRAAEKQMTVDRK
jgi:hypothetical protein